MPRWIIRYTIDGGKVRKFEVQLPYKPSVNQALDILPVPQMGGITRVVSIQAAH